jgi:hypothetical protein
MKIKSTCLFVIFLFNLFAVNLTAQSNSEKILCKSFALNGRTQIITDLKNALEVRNWTESIARIEIFIKLENGSESILKSLILSGRYDVVGKIDEMKLTMTASNSLDKTIKINNTELKEEIHYILYVPFGVIVSSPAADLSANNVGK